MNGITIMKYGRSIGYTYHFLIFVYWFADNYRAGHTNWVMIILLGAGVAGLLARQEWADRLWGVAMMLASLYMILAVLSNLAKQLGVVPNHNFGVQIAIGTCIFVLSLVAAVTIFIAGLPAFNNAKG